MKHSKIIYDGRVLMDLTNDTVTEDTLLEGTTAHGPDGELVEGKCTYDSDTKDATATASEIISGKTAYVKGAKKTGTMKNNGGVTGTISSKSDEYTVPAGFHDGSGKVSIAKTEQDKLVADNIRQGVTILGVEGKMSSTEGMKAQSKTVTPRAEQQSVIPDAGYNALTEVVIAAIPYEESENNAGGITVTIG